MFFFFHIIAVVMKEEASPGGHSASFESDTRDLSSQPDHFKVHNSKHRVDKSFFKSWKLPKIGRNRGGGHSLKPNNSHQSVDLLRMGTEDQANASQEDILVPTTEETTDDILNKYRSKPSTSNSSNAATRGSELSTSSEVILTGTPFNSNNQRPGEAAAAADMVDGFVDADIADDRLVIDPHNVEASFAFHDAKRKLRMMLSEADMSLPPTSIGTNTFSLRSFGFYEKLSVSFESHLQRKHWMT